jgi:hypothetical protein
MKFDFLVNLAALAENRISRPGAKDDYGLWLKVRTRKRLAPGVAFGLMERFTYRNLSKSECRENS